MPYDSGSLDLQDPLRDYSYLSLFPRTCRSLGVVAESTDFSNLESVHTFLKTVGLKDTSRHTEQARMILDSSSEDMHSEVDVNAAVQNEVEGFGMINDEMTRKRRPGLGRMQAKFNFNRRVSQSTVINEPKLDIAKLEDPEEFFLAHERLENAKKELRRQSGILLEVDIDMNDMSLTARPRRPGIPGRSKATYKHHCPSVNANVLKESSGAKDDQGFTSSLYQPDSLMLSQENSKENIHPEATDPIKDGVLGGSIAEVNEFLDEILSGTYDHLNSEGQLTLLQEQLQIKPISIDNLSLPKLPDIPNYDFKISGNFSKPRKSVQDIQSAFTGINTKTPVKASLNPGSIRFSASPTPPKSPFSNLSSLKKHIMQLNRSKDSFSDFNTDPCSAGGSSPFNCADKQPDSADVQRDSRSKFEVLSSDHELLRDSGGDPDPEDAMVAKASSTFPAKISSTMCDEIGVPEKPHVVNEYYDGSPSNERSDTQMQPGNVTEALNSSEPDTCSVHQHSSPRAGGSRGKQHSTISNLRATHHEDIQFEGDTKTSTNKKTRRKTVPVHRTSIVHSKRDRFSAVATDAQEQESSRAEVQAEHVSMEANSVQPESSIDNSRLHDVELLEKQSKLPDIGSAIPQRSHDMSSHKRKGKNTPVQEHDVRVEVRKRQKRKGIVALAKESCDDQSRFTSAELHDKQSEKPTKHPEQRRKLVDGNVPKASLNKKKQAKDTSSQEAEQAEGIMLHRKKAAKKELSIRKSIAVAGTSFQSGLRRSTRHRVRPLEFWRGERFLYGRLEPDSTLPTLLGVKKYDTPAKKEGKAILKVEDCVDGEKYRELIDLAALH